MQNITLKNLLITEGNRIALQGIGLHLAPDEWLRLCEEILEEDLPPLQEQKLAELAERVREVQSREAS